MDIYEAEGAAEALAIVEKERPHLVILDLMMRPWTASRSAASCARI